MDEFMDEERLEVKDKLHNAKFALLTAVAALDAHIADEHSDIADISDDAFRDLVAMLRTLSADYCIETMCADALQDD